MRFPKNYRAMFQATLSRGLLTAAVLTFGVSMSACEGCTGPGAEFIDEDGNGIDDREEDGNGNNDDQDPVIPDGPGNGTGYTDNGYPDANNDGVPDGVLDNDPAEENSDADGYCIDPESGLYECDDGAPPGSGGVDPGPGEPVTPGEGEGEGEGEPNPGEVCTDDSFLPSDPVPPRIMLVVDKSGSMGDDAVGFPGSKWNGARSAIGDVVTALDGDIEFGLMLYPDGDANNNVCREGSVEVDVEPTQGGDIVNELNRTSPGGGTPTAATLVEAKNSLDAMGAEGGPRVVVLATDGGPNCSTELNPNTCFCMDPNGCDDSRNCLDDVASIAAARELNDAGYAVFVIGIPGSENFTDVLTSLAQAGGTQGAGSAYYEVNDPGALSTALEEIADRVASCRFDLQGAVTDPDGLEVRVGAATIARDTSRQNGWDLVDDDTIELFGATCQQANGGVDVNYCYDAE